MYISYNEKQKEFICYTLAGEGRYASGAGFYKRSNGVYYTRNFSIAKSMLFYTRDKVRNMLINWNPRSNNEERIFELATPPEGLNYLSHQPEGIRFALDRKRALIADQMRVGKMIQIAGYIRSLLNYKDFKRVLVVMPSKMVRTAQKALITWTGRDVISVCKKVKPEGNGVYVISYTRMRMDIDLLKEWKPDVIVADEAHLIKNEFAKRTIALRELVELADKTLFATGTPAPNSLQETFYMLNILDEERFSSYNSHESNVKNYIHEVMIRRTRKEVFGMPDKSRRYIYLTQEGIKKQVKDELKAYQNWGGRKVIEFESFSRARREAAIKKVNVIKQYIDEQLPSVVANKEKLLIGCYHLSVMEQLVEHIKNKLGDRSVVLINGETSVKEDTASMDAFNYNDECLVMVCSQRSVLGQTFTAPSNVIVAEFDYVPANIEQFEDRVFNFASEKRNINIDYIVVENSFDEHMLNVLKRKNNDINHVFS